MLLPIHKPDKHADPESLLFQMPGLDEEQRILGKYGQETTSTDIQRVAVPKSGHLDLKKTRQSVWGFRK